MAFYIDALLEKRNPSLADNLLLHVENCGECQNKIIDIFSFLQSLNTPTKSSQLPRFIPAEKGFLKTRRWYSFPGRIAALFTAFLLLAIYFIVNKNEITSSRVLPDVSRPPTVGVAGLNRKNQQQFPPVRISPATRSAPISRQKNENQQNKIHLNFSTNPNLEYMVNSKSRSFVISVQSPANNSLVGENISFAWSKFTNEAINLLILNNRNEIVFSRLVSDNQLEFKGKLAPGLYYWKLESRDELFHIGKFIVAMRPSRPKQ